jgi:hypothetical protein
MTARRLEPSGAYHGHIWGALPAAYPTDQAERVYRYLLEQMPPDSIPRDLMGYGFQGVAYRFRAGSDYGVKFESLFGAPGGAAPPVDEVYRQERALFGFFVSGLAFFESFSFALHALGAHYKPSKFGLSPGQLQAIDPGSVADTLQRVWPNAPISDVMGALVQDDTFRVWKTIRNMLAHRAIPPRIIYVGGEAGVRAAWRLVKHHFLDRDEPLELVTQLRRPWLEQRVRDLWNGVEQSFPPP